MNAGIIVVAVKSNRNQAEEDANNKSQRLRRELKVWPRLTRYIVPLYATVSSFGQFVALLSKISAGLQHLHSCSAVQGDLTGVEFAGTSSFMSALDDTAE
ncbi:hypothetical protein EV424DRAFT_1540957 [Suillus variegatus]|nr:hypothetical protein EV424DRAFT_1540957 [Suillus variegatus]